MKLRETTLSPKGRVSWAETAKRFGWPPTSFESRPRRRIPDELMCTALRWTIEELLRVQHDAVRLAPNVDVEVRSQVSLAQKLLDLPPLAESSAVRPTR